MMKLKACIIFLFVVCISKQSQAQYYFYNNDYYNNDWLYEAGASVGAMNSLTDLGGRKGIGKRGVKDFSISIFLKEKRGCKIYTLICALGR